MQAVLMVVILVFLVIVLVLEAGKWSLLLSFPNNAPIAY